VGGENDSDDQAQDEHSHVYFHQAHLFRLRTQLLRYEF
jgi:hypothetical protein